MGWGEEERENKENEGKTRGAKEGVERTVTLQEKGRDEDKRWRERKRER